MDSVCGVIKYLKFSNRQVVERLKFLLIRVVLILGEKLAHTMNLFVFINFVSHRHKYLY